MDFKFFLDLYRMLKVAFSEKKKAPAVSKSNKKTSVFGPKKQRTYKNEIRITGSKTDDQLRIDAMRTKYIMAVKNPYYTLKSGDTISEIAKYGVEECSILDANHLTPDSAKNIRPGKVLNIPPARKVKNVRNLGDVSKAMGVSYDFIKRLKRVEDSA